jgi:hypothetical protein
MVATLAKAAGIAMGTVATALDMHRNTLAEKMAGRRPFTEDEIVVLAQLLGTTPGRLFEDPRELLGLRTPKVNPGKGESAWNTEVDTGLIGAHRTQVCRRLLTPAYQNRPLTTPYHLNNTKLVAKLSPLLRQKGRKLCRASVR